MAPQGQWRNAGQQGPRSIAPPPAAAIVRPREAIDAATAAASLKRGMNWWECGRRRDRPDYTELTARAVDSFVFQRNGLKPWHGRARLNQWRTATVSAMLTPSSI